MPQFRPTVSFKTYNKLKKKSAESLRSMLGGQPFMQAIQDVMREIPGIIQAEKPYRDYLEEIAKEVVTKAFPIIEQAGIVLEAKLVDPGSLTMNQNDDSEEEEDFEQVDIPPEELEKLSADKRRIINGITQGASIRGTKSFYLFRETIDMLDESLMSRYNRIVDKMYGIYDDDDAIAMMLAMLSQNNAPQAGQSEAVWDEEQEVLAVKAQAVVFPVLIHELIKGLYEIISLQGFSGDAERNKGIVQKVDKTMNEPEDLRYGKFIYDALTQHVVDSPYNTDNLRELFFVEVYKLEDEYFKSFIENSINGEITPGQKHWVDKTLDNLNTDLRKSDYDDI